MEHKKIKKICFLQNSISRATGGMSSILDLAETLCRLGHDVGIGLMNWQQFRKQSGLILNASPIPYQNVYAFPQFFKVAGNTITGKKTPGSFPKKSMRATIRTMMLKYGNSSRNLLQYLSESDLIIVATIFSEETLQQIRQQTNAPIVYNHAGSPALYEDWWLPKFSLMEYTKSNRHKYIEFCRQFDGILFQSQDQANECISRGAMPASKCYVVPPSCEEQQVLAASCATSPYPSQRRVIVSVGSLQERKAQHLAIEIFSEIAEDRPDFDLHFVGGAPIADYAVDLENMAQRLGLANRVFFQGHRTDYLRFMANAEILIQTSAAEGVSRVLREAMLMKLPIAGFAISGTTSLLTAGVDAVLVEPGNTSKLGEALKHLIEDDAYRLKIADAAFARYLKNNSWPVYASAIKDMVAYFTAESV